MVRIEFFHPALETLDKDRETETLRQLLYRMWVDSE